ncbi:MAG: LCP family protein [Anaerolineales bacterium]|nr:LCP family protein [Anaerolineales bacterium]
MKKLKFPKLGRLSVGQIIFWVITVALGIGAFIFANNLTQCWNLTQLPGIAPAACGITSDTGDQIVLNEEGTPLPPEVLPPAPIAAPELPPSWDGASRINILFIGLDARDLDAQSGPPRSDTMMLVTIDPLSKTAGMLSIPRDMWVNIPGFGYSRINTAYSSGEGNNLPGGGPGLAMKTVSQFLGVPVDYYLQVDFTVFIDAMDWIGCIYVNPTEKMILDPIGGGTDKVVLTPGGTRELCQGWRVLAYARNRHTSGGDFDRARRQQEVVLAIRDKVLDPEYFPTFIAQAPQMYQELSYGIQTNMSFEDALKLAVLAKDIDYESIKSGVIDTTMVTFDSVILGGEPASIMKPIADKIRVLRDDIFTASGPLSPLAVPSGNTDVNLITQAMRDEGARVRIMDGTFTGLEQRAGSFFQSYGMNVTEVAPSPESYSQTVIVVYGPKLYTIKWMQGVFGLSDRQIRFNPDPNSSVDIEIRLGTDISGSIP